MIKKGDTLIEVTLAVGIFSMIAIAIVAVMSSGTSSAQTTLESTLTREEIDSQAEALRFLQSAYVASKDNADSNNRYVKAWKEIVKSSNEVTSDTKEEDLVQFHPTDCAELYNVSNDNYIANQKAFVIDTHALGDFENADEVIIKVATSSSKFAPTTTYPHLIYQNESKKLTEDSFTNKLFRADGIYVVAVKDKKTTKMVNDDQNDTDSQSAFYDFYIRACWYGSDAKTPSTISTVIRLYDPDVINSDQ